MLPKPKESGPDSRVVGSAGTVALHLAERYWTRAESAHFPSQDIQQLREIIKAAPPQELIEPSYARIVTEFVAGCPFGACDLIVSQGVLKVFGRVYPHGAEFVDHERSDGPTDALVAERQRPRIENSQQKTYGRQERSKEKDKRAGNGQVHDALQAAVLYRIESRHRGIAPEIATPVGAETVAIFHGR